MQRPPVYPGNCFNKSAMYLVKTPVFIQNLFSGFRWKMPVSTDGGKTLYLTFDDGPIPQVTPWVLSELNRFDAKATFFCVGENVSRYPDILDMVLAHGHSIGNHTYNHLNGWNSENLPYFHNIRHCAHLVQSNLFRPPYGKMTTKQAEFLQRHYDIIMWDVLSGDFDPKISAEKCLQNVLQNSTDGSIIVFHDSLKAEDKLRYVLPRVLTHFDRLGYRFEAIAPAVASEMGVVPQYQEVA